MVEYHIPMPFKKSWVRVVLFNKKSSPKAAHSQNSAPSKNILTDIMFYCFKFLPVGVIPARSTADGIEEAVHAYMNVGILLGEAALNA